MSRQRARIRPLSEATPWRSRPKSASPTCAFGGDGCSEPVVPGRRFCRSHADELERIRRQLEGETDSYNPRRARGSCSVGPCELDRVPGADRCAYHRVDDELDDGDE